MAESTDSTPPRLPVARYDADVTALQQALADVTTLAALEGRAGLHDWTHSPSFERVKGEGRITFEDGHLLLSMAPENRFENEGPPPHGRRDPFMPWVHYYNSDGGTNGLVTARADGKLADKQGRLLDGNGIIVIDRTGRIFIDPDPASDVRHSSLSSGGPVRFAGEVAVRGGVIVGLSLYSGHYRPPEIFLLQALAGFREARVDTSQLSIIPSTYSNGIDVAFPPTFPSARSRNLFPMD